ncbi:hypothetical protein VMCG_02985 [Cytospora schulzeri]|uniref:peptidylprolyl isomerase n=1 Tax=Cytospora schulzeri TaxID=448051 RepID=A0A423WZ43_9PEZI|nr:hypothetical protein VMCG_02985 [Valsa malicola]
MEKQRYLVVIVPPPSEVAPSTPGRRVSLLIPFNPHAATNDFIDELWKRLSRHGDSNQLTPDSHHVKLHLGEAAGPIIDVDDALCDIVLDTYREKIFAVFSKKRADAIEKYAEQATASSEMEKTVHGEKHISIRIITPSTARRRASCPILKVPLSNTVRQLHCRIAETLSFTSTVEEEVDACECNCTLAAEVVSGPSPSTHFLVIHGKSMVEQMPLAMPTKAALKQALSHRFGHDLETEKYVTLRGAETDTTTDETYTKTPVVSICSKKRHTLFHADRDLDDTGKRKSPVLDLHTSELPIHSACFDSTLEMLGLQDIAIDGTLDIFALTRLTTGEIPVLRGKSGIFRSRAHWEPVSQQSDRGMAMFLSTVRVFTSLVQDAQGDGRIQDAVLYVFELLSQFPPALRCLHILIRGKTPTAMECAALSQATLAVLDDHLPLEVIGKDCSRLFEGSRLLFGYILETARSLSQISVSGEGTDTEKNELRYSSAFLTIDLCDHKTKEPVLRPVQTNNGLMEIHLFRSLQDTGVLAESHLQSYLVQYDMDPNIARFALQTGGTLAELTVLSLEKADQGYYGLPLAATAVDVLDLDQLSDLGNLAEICGRNNLAVHKPSQLVSAIAPRLTFDRNAHLAVYTGEQACAEPGKSSIIFRPQHGEETIDPAVLEQLIAPIIKEYEKDGTAVFDASGGAEVRKMQNPDEVLVFCVDSSSSMGWPTDFEDDNQDDPAQNNQPSIQEQAERLLDFENYNWPSLDDTRENLASYESFDVILGIVADAPENNKAEVAGKSLDLLTLVLSSEIIEKSEALGRLQQAAARASNRVSRLDSELQGLKAFWAGIKAHEEPLRQFLRWRATCVAQDAAQKWTWSFGDPIPAATSSEAIPILAAEITEVPDHLRCPISHHLMEDAVKATDGCTYSRAAISRWFAIRKSSPLHGAPLDDISLVVDAEVRQQVASWISGGRFGDSTDVITVTFDSRMGSFNRTVSLSSSPTDLYKLAYRGLLAKFEAFHLSSSNGVTLPTTTTANISSFGMKDGDYITIHLPEDSAALAVGPSSTRGDAPTEPCEMCLVKVYSHMDREEFSYWIRKDTHVTITSIIWKFWRYQLQLNPFAQIDMRRVHTNVTDSGDGWYRNTLQRGTDELSRLLTRSHCSGMLGTESVYSNPTSRTDPKHLVLKVLIREPNKTERYNKLTRLDVLKQMFEALVNRMLAYNYKTHVGLVKFSSEPHVVMPITHVMENFRRATSELKNGGDTALWDALALAGDQIEHYAHKYPDAKKRIIVISDGNDTKSSANTSHGITLRLLRRGISVDSVCIGNERNENLRTLSYLLGSYRFHPTSLANALTICEMEPFLSLTQRPPITFPFQPQARDPTFSVQFQRAKPRSLPTVVTGDQVPPIREHPNLRDDFVQLTDLSTQRRFTGGSLSSSGSTGSKLRVPRLMKEMKTIAARPHPKYDIYVSTTDVSFWKVVMEGPDESPYSKGTFLLYLHAEERYPAFAPKARFVTNIKHPNVNAHGRVCHSILDRDWTSDTSMTMVLDTIYGLLFQPEHSDPVNTLTTLGFHHDEVEFASEVREHVRKHASTTRNQWKARLLGDEVPVPPAAKRRAGHAGKRVPRS